MSKVVSVRAKRAEPAGESPPKKKHSRFWGDLGMLAFKVLLVTLFLVLIFTFLFGIAQVRDQSMRPSVKEGDLAVYYRLETRYEKDDLIVFDTEGSKNQVRRIIGVPGDEVNITEDGLMLNGYRQLEEEIYSETLPYVNGTEFPLTVPDGYFFVLGDNRENAEDSRYYGLVSQADTKGRVVTQLRRRGF